MRLSRAAEIMYAWPVIQPGVAITSSTSPVEGGAALAAAAVEAAASGLSLAVAKPATGGEAAGAALGGASGAGALGGAAGRSSAIALVAHSPSWKPACEWTIPFGLPVDPLVYRMKSGCDASTGTGGSTRQSRETSSRSDQSWRTVSAAAPAAASSASWAWARRLSARAAPAGQPCVYTVAGGGGWRGRARRDAESGERVRRWGGRRSLCGPTSSPLAGPARRALGGRGAAAAASREAAARPLLVMRRDAPTSSSLELRVMAEVPAATATKGTPIRLAACDGRRGAVRLVSRVVAWRGGRGLLSPV